MRLVLPYRKNSWMRKCICVAARWISAIHFLNGSGFSTHGEPRNPCAKKRGKLLGVALTLLLSSNAILVLRFGAVGLQ